MWIRKSENWIHVGLSPDIPNIAFECSCWYEFKGKASLYIQNDIIAIIWKPVQMDKIDYILITEII